MNRETILDKLFEMLGDVGANSLQRNPSEPHLVYPGIGVFELEDAITDRKKRGKYDYPVVNFRELIIHTEFWIDTSTLSAGFDASQEILSLFFTTRERIYRDNGNLDGTCASITENKMSPIIRPYNAPDLVGLAVEWSIKYTEEIKLKNL